MLPYRGAPNIGGGDECRRADRGPAPCSRLIRPIVRSECTGSPPRGVTGRRQRPALLFQAFLLPALSSGQRSTLPTGDWISRMLCLPKSFRNLKKGQATFQPLSSRIPAPESEAFSASCPAIAQPHGFRGISPRTSRGQGRRPLAQSGSSSSRSAAQHRQRAAHPLDAEAADHVVEDRRDRLDRPVAGGEPGGADRRPTCAGRPPSRGGRGRSRRRRAAPRCCVIAPLVTWKTRASCAGVFSPPSRAKWFSTMKCDSSMPRGSTRVSRVRASFSTMTISLKSAMTDRVARAARSWPAAAGA